MLTCIFSSIAIVSSTLKVQDKVLEMKHKVKELINQKLRE